MPILHRIMSLEQAFLNPRPAPMIPSLPASQSSSVTTSKARSINVSKTQSITKPKTEPITFETLPVEVRLQIYKPLIAYILIPSTVRNDSVCDTLRSIHARELASKLAIMRVSKKIHLEFKDVLWSNVDLTVELTKQMYVEDDFFDVQIHESVRRLRTQMPFGPFFPELPIKKLIIKIDINPVYMDEFVLSLSHLREILRGMAPRDVPLLNCALFKQKIQTLVSMLRMVPKIHRMHIQFCDLKKYGEYQGINYLLKTRPEEVFESVDEILEIFEEGGFEEEFEHDDLEGDEWKAFKQVLARPLLYSCVEKK